MKQFTKKILALSLALALSFTGITAKAEGTNEIQYDGEGSINILSSLEAEAKDELLTFSFDLNSKDNTAEYKVTVPSGVLIARIETNSEASFQVYDENGKCYNSKTKAYTEGLYKGATRVALDAGTYIIKISSIYKSFGAKGTINLFALNSKEKVLKADTTMISNLLEDGRVKYKIWVPSDTNIVVFTSLISDDLATQTSGVNVRILNSEGTGITSKYMTTDRSAYGSTFSLKKGTYYVEVSGGTGAVWTSFSVDDSLKIKNSGSTKEKAAELNSTTRYIKFNADAKTKNVQWFKFTLKKPAIKTIGIGSETLNNSKYKITVYSGSEEVYSGTLDLGAIDMYGYLASKSISYSSYGTRTEFPKGTYYVKIEELSKYCNGALSVVLE